MSDTVRVRFAPSPTGFLHIGGARTALFNFLYARANKGKFLLRIEDTDTERSEARFTDDILESLKWLGLNWDEEPVFQSKRFDRYHALAEDLRKKGLAYYCECTTEELDRIRELCQKEKRPFRYPGTCRKKGLTKGVLRVQVPSQGETQVKDLIRGDITFQNRDIDDWVVLRANAAPTYNFSVVVDDHDQKMTHILRGDDHINNTPKQILLYQALGFAVPQFAHLPMILGPDRTKLSKRHGAGSTLDYRRAGYLPEAVINFLVRLGWSHGDQEIFTPEELCQYFSLDHIGVANAIFSPDKLNWVSGQWMNKVNGAHLWTYLREYFRSEIQFMDGVEPTRAIMGIEIIRGKTKTILELIDQLGCLFGPDPSYATDSLKPDDKVRFKKFLQHLAPVLSSTEFDRTELDKAVRSEAEKLGEKLSPLAQALRYAVTGGRISPGIFEMLELQGKETVLRRLQATIQAL